MVIYYNYFLVATSVIIAGALYGAEPRVGNEKSAQMWLTGKNFRQELERPFSASWTEEELRRILLPVSQNRQVSIVIDRRIDPSAEYQLSLNNVTLLTALKKTAEITGAELSLPDNLIYFGPPHSARLLRTVIELRDQELKSKESGVSERRRSELQRRRTTAWSDLTTPREILNSLCDQRQLKLKNEELIRHDLWAAATLPEVSTAEAMSTILIQFDLTFQWQDAGESVEILPLPERMAVSRKYRSSTKFSDALEVVQHQFPQVEVEASKGETIVQGTIEAHEAIAKLMSGQGNTRTVKEEPLGPVKNRLFTFRVEQPVPISAIMKELEKSKIQFEYDAADFNSAGIDLEQVVQIEVKNASANKFFSALFQKAGVDFEFNQSTVRLKPSREKTNHRDTEAQR